MLSGADDGTTQVWQIKDGKRLHFRFDVLRRYFRSSGYTIAIAFYANDHRLVVNEWYRSQYDVGRRASIRDLDTGHEVDTLSIAPPNNDDLPRSGMAINPQSLATDFHRRMDQGEKHGLMLQSL